MRLGILGGSFDPVHFGHLLLAETCREACQLDEVVFVPAAVPPHKLNQQRAPGSQRVEMLKLAIGGHPALSVSTIEIDRGGISYTADTLRELRAKLGLTPSFFCCSAPMHPRLAHLARFRGSLPPRHACRGWATGLSGPRL